MGIYLKRLNSLLQRWSEKYVVFHAKKDSATNANAHLAHLQAPTHKLILQLAKEPNLFQPTSGMSTFVVWIKLNLHMNLILNIFKRNF